MTLPSRKADASAPVSAVPRFRVTHGVGRRYGAAILLAAAALGLTLAFESVIQPTIFLLFFPAVAVSAWYGGRGPAVVTSLLAVLVANYYLIPPTHSLDVAQPLALARLGIFLLVALLIGSLTESLRAQVLVRIREQEALLQSEARFRATFQNAAVGIAHVGLEGQWLGLNDRLCEILGHPRERLVELSWQDITHPEDLNADEEQAARLFAGDIDSYRLEKRYRRGDGSTVWTQLTGSVVRREDGEPDYFIAVVEDISARKEAERRAEERQLALEEANRARSTFMATVSHELRTPLNAVIGYADLLTEGVPEPIGHGALQQVHRIRMAARHLLQLIEEVLTFSRLEAGRERVNVEEIEISRLIEEVRAVAEPLAAHAGLAFAIEVPADVQALRTDPRKLRQVLLNLLGNAIKFTDEGDVRLAVAQEGSEVRFVVSDTGIGISEADLEQLCDPFWQADGSHTRQAQGSGLGLTISERFAQLLGGTLEVVSEVGAGSTFTLRVPLAPPSSGEDASLPMEI